MVPYGVPASTRCRIGTDCAASVAANMGHDERTEGKAGQCQRQAGMGLAQMGDDGEHVLRLAAALLMLTRRALDPAEIRPHGQEAEAACQQHLGYLVRHLVRGRSAQRRMRMRHQGSLQNSESKSR